VHCKTIASSESVKVIGLIIVAMRAVPVGTVLAGVLLVFGAFVEIAKLMSGK
jgi:hypothetical protein